MSASLDFLDVPQRPAKPRESGLTLVRDQGHSLGQLEDMLPTCGPFVDYAKIKQFELFYMDAELTRAKVRLYREHAVKTFCGGTVVEAALIRNKVKETLRKLKETGFVAIELSDNIVDLTIEKKVNLIGEAVDVGFEVLFEYGKKYDEEPIDVAEAAREIQTLLGAGATRIILERSQLDATLGPDGKRPTAGRLRELADAIGRHRLVFEAETPAHVMWLLHEFGADANLGPNLDMSYVVAGLEPARCGLGRAEGYSFFEKLRT